MADLIPQPHGGALHPPWPKGVSGSQGPARNGSSVRAARKRCFELLKEASEEAVQGMIAIARSDDPRAALAAQAMIIERTFGKATDQPLMAEDSGKLPDLSAWPEEDRREMQTLLARVTELMARHNGEGGV